MKKIILPVVIALALYGYLEQNPSILNSGRVSEQTTSTQLLSDAYDNRARDIQVEGSGEVIKLLPDDTDGSQHQKFILKLSSGQTLLIAHNIDLAPRIDDLRKGDVIEFYGEYEWNSKGGVVHWTHHDPDGHHEDGWLNHNGDLYQ